MSSVEVVEDILTDDIRVLFEKIGIACSFFGGEFERHMEQLPDVGIVLRMRGDMSQGICPAGAVPSCHFGRIGKFRHADIDNAGVGFRQGADLFQGQRVDLSNECDPIVTRFG